ncbi:aminotransferase class I/II-fold pyridoxal phosphate-dependent enzyme [Alkaliphilus serpentinus]|uniref:Aminotransferase n=1 Tax=Alkaliphilus serpentinus TaxID=1482731 RepID=A0A833HMU9_9FIRM|nr:aminotransferase class I/II-fold pyridoxal phosphate-dependent enzyme [Alkaliphilus serpentinus]KAB3528842.1 aminotransferase class I/II-fold pyridoxal phosphate-dependent enzyme [Alkaliphilus serpentinus]
MKIKEFKLERYFAIYEFTAQYLLSPSDCESLTMEELVANADEESLRLWNHLKLSYTESMGHPILRKEIASLYKNIDAQDVITFVPEEGIFVAMNAVVDEGDHVIVIDPIYQSLAEICKSLGASVTNWRIEEKDNQWHLDIDFLERNIQANTKMIIINFPHNPTGYMPTRVELNKIIEIAKKYNLYIFSDEMYWLLEHSEENALSSVADLYEKGISLFGLSKTFSLPGLRLGWITTQDHKLMKELATLKDYTTICGSAPSEILGIMALRQKEAIVKRNKERIQENLIAARSFFHKFSNLFTWIEPNGGSIAFPRLNSKINVVEFCDRIVKEQNIMIVPGDIFDYEGNYFRIGLGRDNFKEILNKLEEYFVSGYELFEGK